MFFSLLVYLYQTMKRFKMLECSSAAADATVGISWDLCILCQSMTAETLQCPNDSKRPDKGAGYKSLAASLQDFNNLGELPATLQLSKLDEGCGIEATLSAHCAKWHKSCRNVYNKTMLDRALKRKSALEQASSACCDHSSLSSDDIVMESSERFTRSCLDSSFSVMSSCFICNQTEAAGQLHQVTSFDVDYRVRNCAHVLQDSSLLAKICNGDLIALEAKYHARCLVGLYKQADTKQKENAASEPIRSCTDSLVFAQLTEYISELLSDPAIAAVFKLSDLAKMYQKRLVQLGGSAQTRVNTTKLKNKLLSHFPGMRAQPCGKEVLLVFDEDIGRALSTACHADSNVEALTLVKAAHIVRRDIFGTPFTFNGQFTADCQQKSVPQSLTALVQMILHGASIDSQSEVDCVPAALSVSQLIAFNCVKHIRKSASTSAHSTSTAQTTQTSNIRHNMSQEKPLPLYLSLMLHAETRKRDLVDKLFKLGLCVSYDRLLQISANLANRISDCFDITAGVCPPPLRGGLFTTAAVDNIDHNPGSTTAADSFHGTGISLVQHCSPGEEGTFIGQQCDGEIDTVTKVIKSLPSSYTSLPPVASVNKDSSVPKVDITFVENTELCFKTLTEEYEWLDKVSSIVNTDSTELINNCSWAAYHASLQPDRGNCCDVSILLPLFRDPAHSPAMLCHTMTIVASAVRRVNPGQVPVLTLDQPLYTLAKQIQWNWPEKFGEKEFVLVLGGLHIEMAFMKTIGDWLDGSGWTTALVNANITSVGRSESMLHASHVSRTRHVHQVTAASLYVLQQQSYMDYVDSRDNAQTPVLNFTDWCEYQCKLYPMFQYWHITLQLQLTLLVFVRSVREANFLLYVESLAKLLPWFFALNHHHYARWCSVHLRDMRALHSTHPDIAKAFTSGMFTVNTTGRPFSSIALDQAHEQLNARVKGVGGAVGLTENADALLRWMVAGPEVSRVISEFELPSGSESDPCQMYHHEQTSSQQSTFVKQVESLTATLNEMGNPFVDDGSELYSIDSHTVCSSAVVQTVRTIESTGQHQCSEFLNERLLNRTVPVTAPVSRNALSLFKQSAVKKTAPHNAKLAAVRNDCSLFSRLYIACQTRNGDLDTFFVHENQPNPPALSSDGNIRLGTKSDLLVCLESVVSSKQDCPTVDAIVLDGAAIVQMLHPAQCKTFNNYAQQVFVPYICSQLNSSKRLDLVWDQYLSNSLKAVTRAKRGSGIRRKVVSTVALPRNWTDFLHSNENKAELFHFLSLHVTAQVFSAGKQVIVTDGSHVISSPAGVHDALDPCSHEEADTRMLLHVADAVKNGHTRVMIRTVDTDVVVLAVACFSRFTGIAELWVAFGVGKHLRFIAIHEVVPALGLERAHALPFFHAFTGCDTVSCFAGRGKKTAWDTWNSFPDVTPTFVQLSSQPLDVEPFLSQLQRFVVLMYDRSSSKMTVNSLRKHLFTKRGRTMEGLPPTEAALFQHTKRAAFQSGYCWHRSLQPQQNLPSPSEWGWVKNDTDGDWKPLWTTIPVVADCCPELLKCGCKKGCTKRCKCSKAKAKCTALCNCDGQCNNELLG
jgi:hypothetical protein